LIEVELSLNNVFPLCLLVMLLSLIMHCGVFIWSDFSLSISGTLAISLSLISTLNLKSPS
jgi:hypothetical protein